jgi:predicted nucleic acid-binding Zn ribbon protein
MPIYLYEHPKTGKIIEVVQGMNEKHEYVDPQGVAWRRVFCNPNAGVDTKIDPFSAKDFANKTSNKRETLGDIYDRSKEASEARKNKLGYDPVRKKYWEEYSKKRKGKRHPLSYED